MTTIPYIKCNDTLYKEIKPLLEQAGYTFDVYWEWSNFPYLVINMDGQLGKCTNIEYEETTFNTYHRELCDSTEEFIEKARQLMKEKMNDNNHIGQTTMKKSDLQTGMIVETNNGKKYVVIGNLLLGENDSHSFSIYDDELRCEPNEWSIQNIYEASQNWAYGMKGGIPTTPLLWSRKKKYTLKEITEALGLKEDEFELDI